MKIMKISYLFLFLAFYPLAGLTAPVAPATYGEAMQTGEDDFIAQNYVDARIDYHEAMSLAKTDIEKDGVYLSVGQLDIIEKKFDSSREQFKHIIELSDADATMRFMAFQGTGQSYLAEENYDRAREEFLKALSIPDISQTLLSIAQANIAMSYFLAKEYPQARDAFNKLENYKDIVPDTLIMARLHQIEISICID